MRILVWLALLVPLPAAVLDRIAVTIDQQIITEYQIDEEIRVTAFLNGQPPVWTVDERRAASDRLIQQALVQREMRLGHYPSPTDADVDKYLGGIVAAFGGSTAFNASLQTAKLGDGALRSHLQLQLTTLRFIEYRFRPNFQITDEEIEAYRRRQAKPASREATREILVEQRTDQILSAWLEETRKQVNIIYLDTSLQ